MTTPTHIADLILSASALLEAEEILLRATFADQAKKTRGLADEVMSAARALIDWTIALPAEASDRLAILGHAVDLDGTDSPLVARAAQALASATEPAVSTAA